MDDDARSSFAEECESRLGYRFRSPQLLTQALSHASAAKTRLDSNERLEFLGDSILGAAVCDLLFEKYPKSTEGELTRIKSFVVSRHVCALLAKELELERFVVIGKGLSGCRSVPLSILSATFESVIAAVFLDGGFDAAKALIVRLIDPHVEQMVGAEYGRNYKSVLQQYAQKTLGETPRYDLLEEYGPDHLKYFKVSASLGEVIYAAAWGINKKEAEQKAAANALSELEGKPAPHTADQLPPEIAPIQETSLAMDDGSANDSEEHQFSEP